MTTEEIAALFAGGDGGYRFARWRRPLVPVVFGVEDATLATLKTAFAGHRPAGRA